MPLRIGNYGEWEGDRRSGRPGTGYHPPACTCFACNEGRDKQRAGVPPTTNRAPARQPTPPKPSARVSPREKNRRQAGKGGGGRWLLFLCFLLLTGMVGGGLIFGSSLQDGGMGLPSWVPSNVPFAVPASTPTPQPATRRSPAATATLWEVSGSAFRVKADLAPILEAAGPGVYTVQIWAKAGEERVAVTNYSIFVD